MMKSNQPIRFTILVLLAGTGLSHAQPAPQPMIDPLDQSIAWMQEARRNYTAVRDYTCTMVSRELVKGKLEEENVIDFRFKAPFSVYMRWIGPASFAGQ